MLKLFRSRTWVPLGHLHHVGLGLVLAVHVGEITRGPCPWQGLDRQPGENSVSDQCGNNFREAELVDTRIPKQHLGYPAPVPVGNPATVPVGKTSFCPGGKSSYCPETFFLVSLASRRSFFLAPKVGMPTCNCGIVILPTCPSAIMSGRQRQEVTTSGSHYVRMSRHKEAIKSRCPVPTSFSSSSVRVAKVGRSISCLTKMSVYLARSDG